MWGPQSLHRRPPKYLCDKIMKISDSTLDKIHDTSIVTVAEKLGIKLYGIGDEGRRACCPYHEDQHPSLHFSTKRGCFKCFVCGAKGDAIKLVQDHENLSFNEACEWIIKECDIIVVDDKPLKSAKPVVKKESAQSVQSVVENKPVVPLSIDLVTKSLSTNSEFCKSVVTAGYLTEAQMRHAAERYRLGASKEGGVIFWEIDQLNQVRTGKLMRYLPDCHRDKQHTPTWVHSLLQGNLPAGFTLQHCLFGEHLLRTGNKGVAIVESEKTAIICSQLFPDFIWLSCGGLQMFKPELLAPLVAHKVILFPDTDEKGEAYKAWLTVAQQAQKLYPFQYPLRISPLLETNATPEQKQRKIDIVDYLFET